MRLKKIRHFILILGLATLFNACNLEYFDNAEFQDFVWDPTLAVPVGEISYTVSDLFEELNDPNAAISTNTENVVSLLYVEELSAQDASAFLAVRDQGFAGQLNSGIDSPNSPVATNINVNETFAYDLSLNAGEEFDSIFFSGGNFELALNSGIQSEVSFTLTFQSLKDINTDAPLVVNGVLSPASPSFNFDSPLSTYKGVFTDDGLGGLTTNKVLVDLEYNIAIEVGDNLTANDGLDFNMSFTNPVFNQIFGFVGREQLDINSQSIDLDFFNSFGDGAIRFADPKFTFSFDNSFGFPIGIDFRNVAATNSDGEVLNLTGPVTESVQVIGAPLPVQIGQSVKTDIVLEVANSNIDALVSHKPTRMTFDVVAEPNPITGPVQGNFLDANSFLDVDIEVEIPLHIGIESLTAEESMNFDNGEDLDQVKSVMLRLIIDNNIPMGGNVEMVFRNGTGPVYTITDRALFSGAAVGGDGRTTEVTQTITDVVLDEAAVRAIQNATTILVRATLSTTGATSGENVKLFADYQMDIKMAMQASLAIDSSGN